MRIANPEELQVRAVPALAATVTREELGVLLPVALKDVTDPEATKEPSKGALLQLDSGEYVVVFYGHDSQQLTVEFPISADFRKTLDAFLREVPLQPSQISWYCPDLKPHTLDPRRARAFQIKMHPSFEAAAETLKLPPAEANALMYLVMRLPDAARTRPEPSDAVHSLRFSHHRVLSDGSEVAPLQLFFVVDETEKTIQIIGVSRPESDQVLLTHGALRELIVRASSSTSEVYDLPSQLHVTSEGNIRSIGEWVNTASEAMKKAS